MRLSKGVFHGLAACLAGTAAAQDGDLAARRAAAPDYARVCDASGAASFVVPGTETCLALAGSKVGASFRLEQLRITDGTSPFPRDKAWRVTGFETGLGAFESRPERDPAGAQVPRRDQLLAYIATFGDGFATTMSFEAQAARPAMPLGTIASRPDAEPISINGIPAPSFRGGRGGEVPEIVGTMRPEQLLGAVQLDAAAALRAHAGLFADQAPAAPSPAYPVPPGGAYGLGVPGGVQPNMDYLSPGDRLWLQAAYQTGYGAVAGTAVGSPAEASHFGGAFLAPFDSVHGWRPQSNADCGGTAGSACAHRWGTDSGPDAAQRSWLPTFSAAVGGSAQDVRYAPAGISGFGGAVAMPRQDEPKAGPSLIGMPFSGFDIGAEFMYIKVKQVRPGGGTAEPSPAPTAGAPVGKSNPTEYPGRLRVLQRAY